MSYQNFIPTVWSANINREIERACVMAEDCNREYEGDVKKMGDTVRILGVGRPTVTTTVDKEITLQDAESVEDSSVTMPIRHISYFNYLVDDIDRRQAVGGVMEALSSESSEAVAWEMDKCIGLQAVEKAAPKLYTAAQTLTKDNILSELDRGLERLYDNHVRVDSDLVLTVPPWYYLMLKQAYAELDTDNSSMIKNGRVGRYGGVTVKMSNNVAVSGGAHHIMLRTKRAVAFANPMTHTEAYRPEKKFSDAVKGFVLYEAKIVRPKELIVLNVTH